MADSPADYTSDPNYLLGLDHATGQCATAMRNIARGLVGPDDHYGDLRLEQAKVDLLEALTTARRDALEEAAKTLDEVATVLPAGSHIRQVLDSHARAIRGLKDKPA